MKRLGDLRLRIATAALFAAMLTMPANAQPEGSDKLVFVGLLPLEKPNSAAVLGKLGEAQALRLTVEKVLADLSHQSIVGHNDLQTALGKGYIVNWFRCAGKVDCITDLLGPIGKSGSRTAVTGDYALIGDNYHVHLFTFSIADGKVGKQIEFDVPVADASDPEKWKGSLSKLLEAKAGSVKIVTNVSAATCTIDGTACAFAADGQTLAAAAGTHKIMLGKDGYHTDTIVVMVEQGSEQEVDVPLQLDNKDVGRAVRLTAIRSDKPPVIDGHLDDMVWQKAWLETAFTQHFPDEGAAPTERTELRVLYDDDSIYVGIRCFDSKPETITSRLTRRDRDIESDKVQVDISSKNDKASAYHFQVNAANVQVDGLRSRDSDYSSDLDSIWYSATSHDEFGWTAEMRIPLVALRYNGDISSFGFEVRRVLQRRSEIDEWAYVPRDAKGEVSNYGTLEGLRDLDAARLFQLTPYDSRRVTIRSNQDPKQLNGHVFGGDFGADLKIGITPALTLDATINPDFGTVEVDQVVLNLSNTEVFFPEKRPFFLEGADIFSTTFELFYTRRIGKQPIDSGISTPTGNSAVIVPTPLGQIYGAAKVTGILTGRLSIGLLDAVTARQDETVDRQDGTPASNVLVDPLANFGILRLRQEFASNSSVGVIGTAVNRAEPRGSAAPLVGDGCPQPYFGANVTPAPDGRCTSDAYSAGVDTTLRTEDGRWGVSAQGVASILENGPTRIIPDGSSVVPGTPGYGVVGEVGKYGGEHWLGLLRYQSATPSLDINDVGYAARANYHDFFGQLMWRTVKPHGPFLDMAFVLSGGQDRTWDFVGRYTTRAVLTASVDFENYWAVSVTAVPYFGRYDMYRETHSDALAEYPHGYFYQFDIKTDTRKPLIFEVSPYIRAQLRGIELELDTTLNLRPIPALELDLIGSYFALTGSPRWLFDTEVNPDNSRTFYFGDLDTKSISATIRGTYTFTPSLSLQVYGQAFADEGHFGRTTAVTAAGTRPILSLEHAVDVARPANANPDFRDGTINVNIFLRWEFRAGSALWLLYTRSQNQTAYDAGEGIGALRFDRFAHGPSTDVFLVKLSYLWEPLHR